MILRLAAIASVLWSGVALGQSPPYLRTHVQGKDVCIYWPEREYAYSYDAGGSERTPASDEFFAMDAAFRTWSALASSCSDFKFTRNAPLSNPKVGYVRTQPCEADGGCPLEHFNSCYQAGTGVCDKARNVCNYQVKAGADCGNSNVLIFRETSCTTVVPDADPCYDVINGDPYQCSSKYRCWDQFESTIALTTTTHSTVTGKIFDADIEFNASPASDGTSFLFTTVNSPRCDPMAPDVSCVANDIQNTLTHELGHVVGLDHVEVPGSTMEATAPVGETKKRIIDSGTALGFCTIYPPGQLTPVVCDSVETVKLQMVGIGTPSFKDVFGCQALGSSTALPLAGLAALLAGAIRRRKRNQG